MWHHDVTNPRTCQFSAVCLTVFPFEFRPRTFTIGFYGKNSIISELMILECSFPLSPLIIRQLYLTCIRPSLEYANVAWCGLTKRDQERLEKCNRSAARLITQTMPSSDIPHDILLARAGIPTLLSRRQVAQVKLAFTATRGLLPAHLQDTFSSWTVPSSSHAMAQRNPCIRLPRPRKDTQRKSPFYSTFSLWNSLPTELQRSTNTNSLLLFFTSYTV